MNDLIIKNQDNLKENYCLIFSLDEKPYALNVANVIEIIKIPKISVPQKMPKHVLGIMTYNNISMRVIDLCSILTHKPHSYTIDSHVIIVRTEESFFGIITDNVVDVSVVKTKNIKHLPYQSENNLIQYMYKFNDLFVSVIDLDSVQNVIQKTQFETNDIDVTTLLPLTSTTEIVLEHRQNELTKKFNTNISKVYFDQEQYIIFDLNQNLYSLPIKQIKEIVKYKTISAVSLPAKYDYIEGIFNLRGDFISIVNFKKFLGIDSSKTIKEGSMLIVLDLKEFKLALLVDKIIDIVTVTSSQVVNKLDSKFETKYVMSELYIDNNVISVLNLDKLLADERLYIKD